MHFGIAFPPHVRRASESSSDRRAKKQSPEASGKRKKSVPDVSRTLLEFARVGASFQHLGRFRVRVLVVLRTLGPSFFSDDSFSPSDGCTRMNQQVQADALRLFARLPVPSSTTTIRDKFVWIINNKVPRETFQSPGCMPATIFLCRDAYNEGAKRNGEGSKTQLLVSRASWILFQSTPRSRCFSFSLSLSLSLSPLLLDSVLFLALSRARRTKFEGL